MARRKGQVVVQSRHHEGNRQGCSITNILQEMSPEQRLRALVMVVHEMANGRQRKKNRPRKKKSAEATS